MKRSKVRPLWVAVQSHYLQWAGYIVAATVQAAQHARLRLALGSVLVLVLWLVSGVYCSVVIHIRHVLPHSALSILHEQNSFVTLN